MFLLMVESIRPVPKRALPGLLSGAGEIERSSLVCAPSPSEPLARLLRLWHDPHIRRGRLPSAGEFLLCFFVRDRAADDHVVPPLPVCRRGDLVLGGKLQRVNYAQDLVKHQVSTPANWKRGDD